MNAQRHGGFVLATVDGADAALQAFGNVRGGVHGEDQRTGLKGGKTNRQHQRNAEIHHEHLHQQRHTAENRGVKERKPLQGLQIGDLAQRQRNGDQQSQDQRTDGGFQRHQQRVAEGGQPVQNDSKIQLHGVPFLPIRTFRNTRLCVALEALRGAPRKRAELSAPAP